ncbi:hypothetical protein FG386_000492 [Cryptosporidium ryanae]|uniref:uncharacterized protein n=1 Tax=Cryptosporidium ryanae TaxID=515981 RepID=UPI00351A0AF2|nr:hypothetical protein FG386_000492 [Cryptosporidium ryanae]
MDSNKEEADRCQKLAKKAIQSGDFEKAKRLLEKANRMFPSDSVTELLKDLQNNNFSSSGSNSNFNSNNNSTESFTFKTDSADNRKKEDGRFGKGKIDAGYDESEKLCKKILKAKNYYETLGIQRNADDSSIKKAYKKLALQLHPDKCKAPSAEEAFKKIALAFQTLSDTEKRENYDAFGEEGPPLSHSSSGNVRYYQYGTSSDGFLTPEDLFRMFFGGVPPGVSFQRHRVNSRNNGNRATHYSTAYSSSSSNSNNMREGTPLGRIAGLIQALPVLLMIVFALFGNFIPSFFREESPVFSLNRTREYSREKWTGIHNVSFYVDPKGKFDDLFPPNSVKLQEIEVQIEMIHFTRECGLEERKILQDIAYAKYYQSRSKLEEIQKRKKPNCDKLKWLRENYPSIYKQTMRG